MRHFYCYRNLHTKTFSLVNDGKVIAHPIGIILTDVKFKVSEKGRQKVIREQRKNVHARIMSKHIDVDVNKVYSYELDNYKEIYYNPYILDTFVYIDTLEPIFEAKEVLALNNKIYFIK